MIYKYSLPTVSCLFPFFFCQFLLKIFNFEKVWFFCFCFLAYSFGVISKKILPKLLSQRFAFIFFL